MRFPLLALAIALSLLIATPAVADQFLYRDQPHFEDAFAWRATQRILETDSWQRDPTTWPVIEVEVHTHSHSHSHSGMGNGNVEQWRPLVAKYFAWEDVDRALCLMGYESGGNPNAKNPTSTATGLMQIMHSVWKETFGVTHRSEWTDPELNIYAASVIRATQGWTAWAPYNRGLCR